MTRQTWTAVAAAGVFVTLAVLLAVLPVPFVTWSPGGTQDTLGSVGRTPVVAVDGATTYPTTGRLDLTTVSVTSPGSRLSLPEALLAYWRPDHDALPRDAVYAPSKSTDQVDHEEAESMVSAQDDAVVAGLRAAGEPVTEMPVVSSVTVGGPAHQKLLPGDLIVSVDGMAVSTDDAVGRQIRTHRPGQRVAFVVLRDRVRTAVSVTAVESTTEAGVAVVGIAVGTGYRYRPRVAFDLGQEIGGPSAGLVFALAVYDKLTDGPLLDGHHVAGTGEITPEGKVGPIGGVQEKIAAAERAGATAFLVPAANCDDVDGLRTHLTLVRVDTLATGIAAVRTLDTPGGAARTPRC